MRLDSVQAVRFFVNSEVADTEARLELDIPGILEPVAPRDGAVWQQSVAVVPGSNEFAIELRAVAAGSGYVIARVSGDEPIGRDSVFVTVTGDNAQ
jgi:hypothetical protein